MLYFDLVDEQPTQTDWNSRLIPNATLILPFAVLPYRTTRNVAADTKVH